MRIPKLNSEGRVVFVDTRQSFMHEVVDTDMREEVEDLMLSHILKKTADSADHNYIDGVKIRLPYIDFMKNNTFAAL